MACLSKGNMVASVQVMILFSYAKVNNIWDCGLAVKSHEDVLWLDISMDIAMRMDILQLAKLQNIFIV